MNRLTRMFAGAELVDVIGEMVVLAGGVEPAFGRALLAPLGDDAGGVRLMAQRDRRASPRSPPSRGSAAGRSRPSAGRCRSSVMWRRSSRRCAVMPSAPASAAMMRGADRVGMIAAARVPDGRDMVDIDAEAQRAGHAAARLPGLIAGIAASSGGTRVGLIGRDIDPDQRHERHAEIGLARRAVDQRGRGDDLAARRSTAAIASRDDRPVVTTSSTISTLRRRVRGESRGEARTCLAAARRTSRACPARGPFHGR